MAQRKAVNWGSFDAQHFLNSQKYDFFIKRLYDKALEDIASDKRKRGRGTLSLAKDRQFRKELDDTIEALTGDVYQIIQKASAEEWELSNKKNDAFIHSIMDTSKLAEGTLRTYMDRNLQGLQAFQSRKVDGLGLSDRVWQYNKSFKSQIELGLEVGIGEGASALRMAKQLKENLNEPDKLFRRVRDKGGNLQLSKAAKLYNPGRGIYRSSHKNAMRLARTEINMAYRTADWERWQKLDFVSGFEVKRSNRKPVCKCEVCEQLKGRYPKEFKFLGWHPQCLCFAIPILQEMKELRERRRSRFKNALHGEPQVPPAKPANAITSVPQGFVDWAQDNAARSANWASTPYFIRDNFVGGKISGGLAVLGGLLKAKPQVKVKYNVPIYELIDFIQDDYGETYTEKELSPKAINCGWCGEWAQVFIEKYGGQLMTTEHGAPGAFNGHNFVKFKGKYYDAESPQGVYSVFELEHMKRVKKYLGSKWNRKEVLERIF